MYKPREHNLQKPKYSSAKVRESFKIIRIKNTEFNRLE